MSSEAKIGIAVGAVVLAVVLWFVYPRQTAESPGVAANGPAVEKRQKRAGPTGQSERVRERLAQLRAERMAGGETRSGKGGFPAKLPTPAFNALPPGAAPGVEEPANEGDLDFDSLRDMALIDEDPDNRIAAIWLLASMDEEEPVLPVLTQALSDEDPEVRMAAIQALSEFSEEAPIDSLHMALQDNDAEIRFEALSIVAEMTDERVQPLIQKALDDPDEDVRSLAEGLADLEDSYAPAPTP